MKQTSVEWLFQKLPTIDKYDPYYSDIIKQAKEMEKQQIIDAWRNGDNDSMYSPKELDEQAENYYSENYASKESDKKQQKKLITEIMNEDAKDGLYNISPQKEISDDVLKKTLEDINKQPMTFVPNEISDEEIEKATSERSINYSSGRTYPEIRHLSYANGFIEGAKWYREQLKQRR